VAKAKERFKLPASARVVSCYEAGRDGFWLHRHLRSVGVENQVVDASSIEVSRRLRHVKTDRPDGERLLVKLMRHHAGERGGWSVVRVPSIEEEDARHLHRELERLKRERLAHRVRIQSLLVTQGVRLTIKSALRLRFGDLTLWDARRRSSNANESALGSWSARSRRSRPNVANGCAARVPKPSIESCN